MINPIHVLHCFPSGLTVAAARNEAKKQLDAGRHDILVSALNHIAKRELGVNWADAMNKLSSLHATENPDTSGKGNDVAAVNQVENQTENESELSLKEKKEIQRDFLAELSATAVASEKYAEQIQPKVSIKLSLTDISNLMNSHPTIGYDGIILSNATSAETQAQRDQLMVAVNECNIAHYFLGKCDTNKTVNKKLDSAEIAIRATRYAQRKQMIATDQCINEGALILAAYHLGLKVHLSKMTQATERAFAQAHFNISSRSALLKPLG